MNNLIKEYLEWKGTYAPRASENYKIWLERFIQVCGNKRLHEYTITNVVQYLRWMELRFNSTTRQFALTALKNFLEYCKTQNLACLAPKLIKLPRISPKSHRAVTEGEFLKIIAIIPSNDFISLRDLLIIYMLWDTGVRVSELSELEIGQINEHKRTAVIQTKKTRKKRIIVWSEQTHALLMKYLPVRLELHNLNKAPALFVGWQKHRGWSIRLTGRSVQRIVKYYANRAGIKERITPHSFRHGWAHKRRDMNAPLAFIQRGLGHNHPISSFIYEQYNDVEFERNAASYLKAA